MDVTWQGGETWLGACQSNALSVVLVPFQYVG